MPKDFKYDVIQLIQGVRDRPCLWDKTLENYKDRVERRTAWEEIFHILDDGYMDMTREEKRITGELVLNKWTNIRDTFMKTLKTRMGRPKKKYVFYDHLKFLTKNIPDDECVNDDSFNTSEDTSLSYNNSYINEDRHTQIESTGHNTKKKFKRMDYSEEYPEPAKSSKEFNDGVEDGSNNLEFVELNAANDPRVMNEDEAFFASLLPGVAKYSEAERLQFRLEVLALMKKIHDERKWPRDD